MAHSDVDKVLVIVNNDSPASIYGALLLASGARSHDIATDILFSGSGLGALATTRLDESASEYLEEITAHGGYVYADRSALDESGLEQGDLWAGLKDVLPLEQFKHHATEHTQIITL